MSEPAATQHTPGPWWTRHALKGGDIAIVQGDQDILAECYEHIRRDREYATHECAANARLIAAVVRRTLWSPGGSRIHASRYETDRPNY